MTSRGRVVMLVDNGVEGDSRVQKQARSMAETGWDVTLIGLTAVGSARERWMVGRAEVRLYGIRAPLRHHWSTFRRSWRRPLAYPPGPTAGYRLQLVRARRADLVTRFGELATDRPTLIRRAGLLRSRVALKVLKHWTRFRHQELRRLEAERENELSFSHRAAIAWWTATRGVRSWRRLDPALWDYELALGPIVDDLAPDLIHANDYRMIGVGARAKLRAAAHGRTVRLVWDAHEDVAGMPRRPGQPRWLPAQIAHEREYARHADAVVTVSPALADLLQQRHGLARTPAVVLNCPDAPDAEPDGKLRADCGIGPDTPLMAYCGGLTAVRGVDLVVQGLPRLPGLHLALVSLHPNGSRAGADPIASLAAELGVADRVHLLPYVPHDRLVPYLTAADCAVSPLRHLPNHEIALSNKFFEYSQARLPLVVSDVRAMAATVRETGQGEVYDADDVHDLVRAVRAVLAEPAGYRAAYEKPGLLDGWTWRAQAGVLDDVYRELLPAPSRPPVTD
ncbi:glycosyltransferase family 4 protein [Actinoplanes sp. NPDC089786]|uniref:glycosyltransferase family 4 protein n=1 Tax=Actinoplanes sp. NPDC089786 TaxID=3155185 RepID=UPI003432D56F